MTGESTVFTVEYDMRYRIIRYRIEGFWDVATVARFRAELLGEVSRRAVGGARPAVLGDASNFAVQSASVAEAFQAFMMDDVMPRIGRLALIVATMLNKMQVERAAPPGQMKVFLDEGEAIGWLKTA